MSTSVAVQRSDVHVKCALSIISLCTIGFWVETAITWHSCVCTKWADVVSCLPVLSSFGTGLLGRQWRGTQRKRAAAIFLWSARFFYLCIYESFSSIFVATYLCINSNFDKSRLEINHYSMLHGNSEMICVYAAVCPVPTTLSTQSGTVIYSAKTLHVYSFVLYLHTTKPPAEYIWTTDGYSETLTIFVNH